MCVCVWGGGDSRARGVRAGCVCLCGGVPHVPGV